MTMSPRLRQILLAAALAATLVAAFSLEDEPAGRQVAPRERVLRAEAAAPRIADREPSPAMPADSARAAAGNAGSETDAVADQASPPDPFRAKSWQPPPPPPPRPSAPPLPFKYFGKNVTGEEQQFFLARNDKYLTVRVGEIIDGQYLLEKSERGRLVFLYQPLQERQYLPVGTD